MVGRYPLTMTAIIDALMRRFTPARYHQRQFKLTAALKFE
jgi:hypothetical protein